MKLLDRVKYKRERYEANINFAPFVDVLFALLIVFVAATPIMLGGVNIDLPKGKAEIVVVKREPLVISIEKDGSLFLEKNSIKLTYLTTRLKEMTFGEKDVKIFIKADKNVVYDRIINVVTAVYEAGFFDVTLVTSVKKM